ncbi:MAG: YbaK/EbsC family protein [Acidimicrobiia bacterium]|nr:YbaK/EbsC family protein [Acidimicrobiia bacterium]
MSRAVDRFAAAAADLGVDLRVTRYPAGTRTARDAAAAVGCELGQIVKSLVFVAGGRVVVALVSGADTVDTGRLGAAAGAGAGDARQARAEEVADATGFSIGGVPPFGHARKLETFLDRRLLDFEEVWAAAGAPDACFPIAPGELARLAEASVVDVAAGAGSGPTAS